MGGGQEKGQILGELLLEGGMELQREYLNRKIGSSLWCLWMVNDKA